MYSTAVLQPLPNNFTPNFGKRDPELQPTWEALDEGGQKDFRLDRLLEDGGQVPLEGDLPNVRVGDRRGVPLAAFQTNLMEKLDEV